MDSKKFILNDIKTKNFGDKTLIITQQGEWLVLNKDEFHGLLNGKINEKIMKSNIIMNDKNIDDIVQKQKLRFCHLFQGASLHIVAPTSRCNLRCSYCHSNAKYEKTKNCDMDKKTAKKIVDFIFQTPSHSVKIEFQGGEPMLLFPMVQEIIEYATKKNKKIKKDLRFALVTNLTEIDDDKIKYLIKNKVGLCTSLDGPKIVHDKNRKYYGGKGSYDDVVSWIKTIKEIYKYPLEALMVTTKHTLPYPKEVIDEYIKLGFKRIQIKFMNKLGYAQQSWEDLSYTSEQYLNFWKKAIDYLVELNIQGQDIYEGFITYLLKKILTNEPNIFVDLQSPCGAVINQIAYDHNGDIYTCDEGRQYDLFRLGNVNKNKYKDILCSNESISMIAVSTNDSFLCDACIYKPYCGLCPVCTYSETGTLVPQLATNNRCKIHKGMFDYIFEKLISSEKHRKVFNKWANRPLN